MVVPHLPVIRAAAPPGILNAPLPTAAPPFSVTTIASVDTFMPFGQCSTLSAIRKSQREICLLSPNTKLLWSRLVTKEVSVVRSYTILTKLPHLMSVK
jgi:hypothetical protein